MMYSVILYYHFTKIDELVRFWADHRRKCRELGLLGRVYIAQEGINGTLAGPVDKIDEYKRYLSSLPGFEPVQFKEDPCPQIPFVKLIRKDKILALNP